MSARTLCRSSGHAGVLAALLLSAGCGAQATTAPAPHLLGRNETVKRTTTSTTTITSAPIAPKVEAPPPAPMGDSITASASLRQLCGISDAEGYAHFEFDSAKIMASDNDLFSKIAACVKDGKLGERNLKILGFTDPRGTDDYNMKLGGERATSAKNRLVTLGVSGDKVLTKSLGESEAKGTDETSWAFDRRVEIHLDNEDTEGVNSGPGSPTR
jgi:outer membrane protein OmpA-like peptidoglycan-associated protein